MYNFKYYRFKAPHISQYIGEKGLFIKQKPKNIDLFYTRLSSIALVFNSWTNKYTDLIIVKQIDGIECKLILVASYSGKEYLTNSSINYLGQNRYRTIVSNLFNKI